MNSLRSRSLAEYASFARRRKLILLLPTLVLAIASAVALNELPSLFESSAGMRFTAKAGPDASDLSVRLKEFRKQLTSPESLEDLARDYEPSDPSAAVLSRMRGRIAVEPDAGPDAQSGAFTVSYRAADAETARKAADALAIRLMTLNSTPTAPSEAEVLRKRAADVSVQLRELEAKDPWLAGARLDASAATYAQPVRSSQPSLEAIRAQQMTVESLKDQQYKVQQQLADVAQRITAQRQIVEQQKTGSKLRDNPTYAVLITKRTELQGQRDTLINRQELTDKHPRVLAINDQIAAINRQVEELRQQDSSLVNQSPEARELAALESERNRVKIDLEVTGRELARRSANPPVNAVAAPEPSPARRSSTASKLTEQYLALKRSYQEATSDLRRAETNVERAENSAQLIVLSPASFPEKPVSANRPLLISIAAAVGLALGALFALFAESRRFKSLQDARDVEYYTRLPLLAAIPRTATASERRRARWRSAGRVILATAASAVATFGLTKLLIAAEVFALIAKK